MSYDNSEAMRARWRDPAWREKMRSVAVGKPVIQAAADLFRDYLATKERGDFSSPVPR